MIEKPVIFIIEDDEDIQEIYKEMLTHAFDVELHQGFNGQEGIDLVKEKKPKFIILDLLMPVMNGDEFLRLLRDEMNIKDVPVLVCSVNQTLAHKLLDEKKANAVLPKLFKESELIEIVTSLTDIKVKESS